MGGAAVNGVIAVGAAGAGVAGLATGKTLIASPGDLQEADMQRLWELFNTVVRKAP